MEFAFGVLKFGILFYIVPYLVGLLFATKNTIGDKSRSMYIGYYYMVGLVFMMAVFEVLCVPIHLLQMRLHVLLNTFSALMVLCCGISAYFLIRGRHELIPKSALSTPKRNAISKAGRPVINMTMVYAVLAVILIGLQLYYVVRYQGGNNTADDIEYVTRTSASLYTDRIVSSGQGAPVLYMIKKRSFNSWEIFICWFCQLTGINAAAMVHTVLNAALVLDVFIVFYLIGCELFDEAEYRWMFLAGVAVLNLLGLHSHYSLTFRWLMTMWQGKAVLQALLLPFTICFMLHAAKEGYHRNYLLIFIVLSISAVAASPTGAGMFGVVCLVLSVLSFVWSRNRATILYFIGGIVPPAAWMLMYLFL